MSIDIDDEEALALEPREQFDPAIVGIARRFHSTFLVYDLEHILRILAVEMDDDDDPETAAREHFEFNIVGGWVGEGTPAFMEPWSEESHPAFAQVQVRVNGEAVPQGSKKVWINNGRPMMAEEAGTRHLSWRREVTAAVREAMATKGQTEPILGPVAVELVFYINRRVGDYGSGANAVLVRAGADPYPIKPPDIDKLARSVLDSCTDAKLWADDAQVASLMVHKRWVDRYGGESPGVSIIAGPLA